MAKKQRFPSSANPPKASAAQAAPGPLPEAVAAKKQDVVQVEYKKENNHILGIGAHALAKGINTLPKQVWDDAKKHPSVQKLIADGHLIEAGVKAKFEEAADEEGEEGVEKLDSELAEGSEKDGE